MKVSAIEEIANRDINTEVALLEKQAENISDAIEIYIRLSSLYRLKGNYQQALEYLHKAEKLLVPDGNLIVTADYSKTLDLNA